MGGDFAAGADAATGAAGADDGDGTGVAGRAVSADGVGAAGVAAWAFAARGLLSGFGRTLPFARLAPFRRARAPGLAGSDLAGFGFDSESRPTLFDGGDAAADDDGFDAREDISVAHARAPADPIFCCSSAAGAPVVRSALVSPRGRFGRLRVEGADFGLDCFCPPGMRARLRWFGYCESG